MQESTNSSSYVSDVEWNVIAQVQDLVHRGYVKAIALDFDGTITRTGLQRGVHESYLENADNVILENVYHPAFLRALLFSMHEAGARVVIVSFQDDLVGNSELGIVTGRQLVDRYMDAILGDDRPHNLLHYDHDFLLWNPSIRCYCGTGSSNADCAPQGSETPINESNYKIPKQISLMTKNAHLTALATWSGRRMSKGGKKTSRQQWVSLPKLLPSEIIFVDDSLENVQAALAANVARAFHVSNDGVNLSLCQQIVDSYTAAPTGLMPRLSSQPATINMPVKSQPFNRGPVSAKAISNDATVNTRQQHPQNGFSLFVPRTSIVPHDKEAKLQALPSSASFGVATTGSNPFIPPSSSTYSF